MFFVADAMIFFFPWPFIFPLIACLKIPFASSHLGWRHRGSNASNLFLFITCRMLFLLTTTCNTQHNDSTTKHSSDTKAHHLKLP